MLAVSKYEALKGLSVAKVSYVTFAVSNGLIWVYGWSLFMFVFISVVWLCLYVVLYKARL